MCFPSQMMTKRMSGMSEELIMMMKAIPAGRRKIVKSGDRYMIWLPINLNHIWEALRKRDAKVDVYLVIVKESGSQ